MYHLCMPLNKHSYRIVSITSSIPSSVFSAKFFMRVREPVSSQLARTYRFYEGEKVRIALHMSYMQFLISFTFLSLLFMQFDLR